MLEDTAPTGENILRGAMAQAEVLKPIFKACIGRARREGIGLVMEGSHFIPGVLDKVRHIRALQAETQRLEMDGGIKPENAESCREAGCDILVAASAIFGSDDYASSIQAIRGACREAVEG